MGLRLGVLELGRAMVGHAGPKEFSSGVRPLGGKSHASGAQKATARGGGGKEADAEDEEEEEDDEEGEDEEEAEGGEDSGEQDDGREEDEEGDEDEDEGQAEKDEVGREEIIPIRLLRVHPNNRGGQCPNHEADSGAGPELIPPRLQNHGRDSGAAPYLLD